MNSSLLDRRTKADPKIFGVGLSRTGTTSLSLALLDLNYKCVHWPSDPITQEELVAYYDCRRAPFRFSIADHYDAVTDSPVATVFRELSCSYPTSKFVLTIRDGPQWLDACERFFRQVIEPSYVFWPNAALVAYCKAVNARLYGTSVFERDKFRETYLRHNDAVRDWFRCSPGRLLVLNVCKGEGWPELCAFLGHATPSEPFPHANRIETAESGVAILTGRKSAVAAALRGGRLGGLA